MTPAREAIVVPGIFLTVVLTGSVQPGEALRFAPPPLFALLLGVLVVASLVQSGALAPEWLLAPERSALANLNGLTVLLTLFAASAQAMAVVMPASGVPAVLMGILLFALLAQALAIGADRLRALRGLLVSLALAFTLKFIVLDALSAPATGRVSRIVQLLFEGATLGAVTQPPLPPAAGYIAFATLMLYLFGLILLPRRVTAGLRPRHDTRGGSGGALQPVVEVAASTEGGEAPRGPGATTENIGPYLKEEQRRPRGCIAGRMPSPLSPRAV